MTKQILPKVQGKPFLDALAVGGIKAVSEKFISKTPLGNGNFISGGSKLLVSGFMPDNKGKLLRFTKDAMAIDGVEDVVNATLNLFGFGNKDESQLGMGEKGVTIL